MKQTQSFLGAGTLRCAITLLVAILLGGCVGSQQLITANQKLQTTAGDAKVYAEKVKTAVEAGDNQLESARASVTNLATAASQSARDKAVAVVEGAYSKACVELQVAYTTLLEKWLDITRSNLTDFEDLLKKDFAPIEQARRDAKAKYDDAKRLSGEYPSDSARQVTTQKRLTDYLTLSAIAFQQEDRARAAVSDAWIQSDRDLRSQLSSALSEKRAGLEKAHTDALAKIAAVPVKPIDLGPEAVKLASLLDPLIAFNEGASNTATANLQYFQLYGFGKNSVFSSFFTNLGKGFINGLPIIGNGKTVTAADVTSAINQVVTDAKPVLVAAGTEASGTLKQIGDGLMQTAKAAAKAKITSELAKITNLPSPATPLATSDSADSTEKANTTQGNSAKP
jgi:hypothetical protein